jgi:hypothetical protein
VGLVHTRQITDVVIKSGRGDAIRAYLSEGVGARLLGCCRGSRLCIGPVDLKDKYAPAYAEDKGFTEEIRSLCESCLIFEFGDLCMGIHDTPPD